MSTDDPSHVPADRDRRNAVREKAQQVQAQQSRHRFMRRAAIAVAVVAVVAAAAVVVTWVVGSAVSKPLVSPSNVSGDGIAITDVSGVAMSGGPTGVDATPTPTPTAEPADADPDETPEPTATPETTSVDIRVYVDYLSEGSKSFQLANVQQLTTWIGEDAASLTYYPVAMLTSKSNGTKYSLRAAAAAACVATYSHASFFAFNHALLIQQPDIDSDGLTDRELADLAIASGSESPKTVRACIEDGKYATWAKSATERALKGLPDTDGIALTGTPTILVNGKPYVGALDDPAEFAQFVLTIASDAYYQTPSPTPTPTPSPTATP